MNAPTTPPAAAAADVARALAAWPLACIRFRAGSLGIELPEYAGGILRSTFGLALKQEAPRVWDELFGAGEGEGDSLALPYMLVPPLDGRRRIDPGATFEFELRLFGGGVRHYPACLAALQRAGQLGLGRTRGQFALLAAANLSPAHAVAGAGAPRWQPPASLVPGGSGADWFAAPPGAGMAGASRIALELQTPLRLKHAGHLVGAAPEFAVLWARLHGRASLLLGQALLSAEARAALDARAAAVRRTTAAVRWLDWTRYSARQEAAMKFGGLVGKIGYAGDLESFLPWLTLGAALGVGGKTTFGLGSYRLARP